MQNEKHISTRFKRSERRLYSVPLIVLLVLPARTLGFTIGTHWDITDDALESYRYGSLEFNDGAIFRVKWENVRTDVEHEPIATGTSDMTRADLNAWRHCDNRQTKECIARVEDLLGRIVTALQSDAPGRAKDAQTLLGTALHTLQDFYAHTTWVEGSSGTLPTEYFPQATLTPLPNCSQGYEVLAGINFTSGYFATGDANAYEMLQKAIQQGHCLHGQSVSMDVAQPLVFIQGIAKDFPGKHHQSAIRAAKRATVLLIDEIAERLPATERERGMCVLMGHSDEQCANVIPPPRDAPAEAPIAPVLSFVTCRWDREHVLWDHPGGYANYALVVQVHGVYTDTVTTSFVVRNKESSPPPASSFFGSQSNIVASDDPIGIHGKEAPIGAMCEGGSWESSTYYGGTLNVARFRRSTCRAAPPTAVTPKRFMIPWAAGAWTWYKPYADRGGWMGSDEPAPSVDGWVLLSWQYDLQQPIVVQKVNCPAPPDP